MSTETLPSSPAARAFFAALDQQNEEAGISSAKASASGNIRKRIATLGWRNRHSQAELYPIQVGSWNFWVRQVQRGEVDGTYGTGATVWPASLVLIKFLELQQQLHNSTDDSTSNTRQYVNLKNKRVVDLGSGTGVTSIAAALLGAREVVCTDGQARVVELARDNLRDGVKQLAEHKQSQTSEGGSNHFEIDGAQQDDLIFRIGHCSVSVQEYWWGSDQILRGGNEADVILVSDCVLPKLYPIQPLVEAIDQLLTSSTSLAVLSFEYRYYPHGDPKHIFKQLAEACNLVLETIAMSDQDPVYSVEDIEIWIVRRSRNER